MTYIMYIYTSAGERVGRWDRVGGAHVRVHHDPVDAAVQGVGALAVVGKVQLRPGVADRPVQLVGPIGLGTFCLHGVGRR